MMLVQPTAWVDNSGKAVGAPACLLSGDRMVLIYDNASTTALKKGGIPYIQVTARDMVRLLRRYPNPVDGATAYPIPTPYAGY